MSFWYLQFSQKTNEKIWLYYYGTQVELFLFLFGELKTPKRHFEINWPLGDKSKTALTILIFLFCLTLVLDSELCCLCYKQISNYPVIITPYLRWKPLRPGPWRFCTYCFGYRRCELSKGQKNSKWFFQADVSSKKRTNKFDY